jgi:hypothetical protein
MSNRLKSEARRFLLEGISQFEVDFVIPRLGIDVPLGIDPFLLYKSHDEDLRNLHSKVLKAFNFGIRAVGNGDLETARRLFLFPEPIEIGLGYSRGSRKGAGVGSVLRDFIIGTFQSSLPLLERGVRHIEEMQLLSVGIGPDRISDIISNLSKSFLVAYTQRQCDLWHIPVMKDVPVSHVFNFDRHEWEDGYFDLPVSPIDGSPILLVPRRIVRVLPWINYSDFLRMEFSAYLRAKGMSSGKSKKSYEALKLSVVGVTRAEVQHVDRYISSKEAAGDQARPSLSYLVDLDAESEGRKLEDRLTGLESGREKAGEYQELVLGILNYLFNPDLIDGELEVRTIDGTERRDIIFTNDSDGSFWQYLRNEHSAILLMFEVKNKKEIAIADINQVNSYLGDRLGRIGIMISRQGLTAPMRKKLFSTYNDSTPRKVILHFSDDDLIAMIHMKAEGKDPMRFMQRIYREFRTSVQ